MIAPARPSLRGLLTASMICAGFVACASLVACGRTTSPPTATNAPAAPAAQPGVDPADAAREAGRLAYEAALARDQSEHPTLAIGAPAPAFALRGTDDKVHALADYAASKVLVVVFISNHCPASQLYEGRIKAIADDYRARGVQVVAIAPNGPAAVGPAALNYTDVDDSFESMKIRAAHRKFNFPYLYDGEDQTVSNRYGPKVTPHIFIFDRERKLRYEGRIDDRMQEEKVTVRDARAALEAIVAGKPVETPHTPVFGCSTKWNSHAESARKELDTWRATPVTVETASLEDLGKLRRNGTGKTLMVNFWATWCAPCRTEYPALLETYLWYRSRDFDFVSVSVDEPNVRPAVQKFLETNESGIRNLQVDTDDVYKVMAAFDRTWESGVPFTMVIAPDGSVVYQHSGEVDVLKLRRAILARLPDAGMFAGNSAYWRD